MGRSRHDGEPKRNFHIEFIWFYLSKTKIKEITHRTATARNAIKKISEPQPMYYYKEKNIAHVCVLNERGWTAVMICFCAVLKNGVASIDYETTRSLVGPQRSLWIRCACMCLWGSEAWMWVVIIIVIFLMYFSFICVISWYRVCGKGSSQNILGSIGIETMRAVAAATTSILLEKNSKCKTISRDEKNIKRVSQTQ